MNGASLFLKECEKTIRSIPYLIFLIILLIFVATQLMPEFGRVERPQPGQQSYGTKYKKEPLIIMPAAVKSLYGEFKSNSYTAYPIGFYKNVKLKDDKRTEMAGILAQLTGISKDKLREQEGEEGTGPGFEADMTVSVTVTYEEFLTLMEKADKLIGGGSRYCGSYLSNFGAAPMTYEDALAEYDGIVGKDHITGAYARLFCDYIGILLGFCPVFIAVALGMKDKAHRMRELIYMRKTSSLKIVFMRYLALDASILLPVLLMALYLTGMVSQNYSGMRVDEFAFIKYTFGWLLPTLMVSTAVGSLLTELTGSPIAVLVQGLWWFFALFASISDIKGGCGWNLIPRHNTIGNTQAYLDSFNILMANRIAYTVFALTLVLLTVFIYEAGRRGRFHAYSPNQKIFTDRCKRSEA